MRVPRELLDDTVRTRAQAAAHRGLAPVPLSRSEEGWHDLVMAAKPVGRRGLSAPRPRADRTRQRLFDLTAGAGLLVFVVATAIVLVMQR